jgi:hypothetical protein
MRGLRFFQERSISSAGGAARHCDRGDKCFDAQGRRRHHAHDRDLPTPMPLTDPNVMRPQRLLTPPAEWLDNRHRTPTQRRSARHNLTLSVHFRRAMARTSSRQTFEVETSSAGIGEFFVVGPWWEISGGTGGGRCVGGGPWRGPPPGHSAWVAPLGCVIGSMQSCRRRR